MSHDFLSIQISFYTRSRSPPPIHGRFLKNPSIFSRLPLNFHGKLGFLGLLIFDYPIPMPHFQFHHHGGRREEASNIPKGYVAITVGQGAEMRRFVIPVVYVNHPLFTELLKEAEEEYGFDQEGPINIPCQVDEFCHVTRRIDDDTTSSQRHRPHQLSCFRA